MTGVKNCGHEKCGRKVQALAGKDSDIYLNRSSREQIFETVFFRSPMAQKTFSNESLSRCDRFRQIFVQIGAILAIFRPFELFGRLGDVNGALMGKRQFQNDTRGLHEKTSTFGMHINT